MCIRCAYVVCWDADVCEWCRQKERADECGDDHQMATVEDGVDIYDECTYCGLIVEAVSAF